MIDVTRPNVLFLLSDEHSYRFFSHLDPAGEGEPCHTPAFDRLAAQSCVMHSAYCQVPLCTPSRICLLTGQPPIGSGGWNNGAMMREGVATIPQAFAEAGYATCLVGKMHLGGDRQFVGFEHRPYGDLTGATGHQWEPLERRGGREVRDRTRDAGVTEVPESAAQEHCVAAESLAWLREQRHARADQPWLVCASFSRPHFPLTAPRRFIDRYPPDQTPPPKVGRTGDTADHPMTVGMARGFQTEAIQPDEAAKGRAGYFACVDYLDQIVGDMLALLERDGLLENTIIVYASDHGELAGEHGMWWKNSWHEAAARVPLMVSLPEHRRGDLPAARLHTPVSLADLFPTLGGLCGVAVPDDLSGVDLAGAIRANAEPTDRGPVVFDNPSPRWGEGSEHRVVRDGKWKYVRFRGEQMPDLLFDLEADPLEQRNLADDPAHAEAAARLRQWIDAGYDFDQAQRQHEADQQATRARRLASEVDGNNLYLMPSGKLVDADAPLYHPRVITDQPARFFSDYPG